MSTLDISCEDIFDLVGAWHDRELSERDQNAFEQHLLICPPCLAYSDRVRRALAALEATATVAVPEGLSGRVTTAVLEQARSASE